MDDRLRRMRIAMLAVVAMMAMPAAAQPAATPSRNADADALATALVARMTLEEKLPQLLNTAPAIPRLDVPAYNWWTESLHGALGTLPTTNFPEPIGLAASFDEDLVQRVAAVIATEVRGLHALARQTGRTGRIGTGLNTWSPNLNIFRDPRWGRGQETYGEDPFLTARIGVAYVRGMQGDHPQWLDVVATPKHYAVHSGPESTRHHANVYVSRRDLEDTYLPAFRAAVVEGGAGSVMCAYNRVDGQPACASDLLLRDTLRGAWGFDGYVVSDCDAVTDIRAHHHYAPDAASAVAAALRAGVDNECTGATLTDTAGLTEPYRQALERGLVSMADIDRALAASAASTGDGAGDQRGRRHPRDRGRPWLGRRRRRPGADLRAVPHQQAGRAGTGAVGVQDDHPRPPGRDLGRKRGQRQGHRCQLPPAHGSPAARTARGRGDRCRRDAGARARPGPVQPALEAAPPHRGRPRPAWPAAPLRAGVARSWPARSARSPGSCFPAAGRPPPWTPGRRA